jgi:hypothetical protein
MPWNATIPGGMGDVQQEEKIMTAGLETSVPIRGDAMERHHPWWHRRTCGRKKR